MLSYHFSTRAVAGAQLGTRLHVSTQINSGLVPGSWFPTSPETLLLSNKGRSSLKGAIFSRSNVGDVEDSALWKWKCEPVLNECQTSPEQRAISLARHAPVISLLRTLSRLFSLLWTFDTNPKVHQILCHLNFVLFKNLILLPHIGDGDQTLGIVRVGTYNLPTSHCQMPTQTKRLWKERYGQMTGMSKLTNLGHTTMLTQRLLAGRHTNVRFVSHNLGSRAQYKWHGLTLKYLIWDDHMSTQKEQLSAMLLKGHDLIEFSYNLIINTTTCNNKLIQKTVISCFWCV